MPEEQWQISGGESALSGPDPRRREEEFFLFQREGLSLQIGGSYRGYFKHLAGYTRGSLLWWAITTAHQDPFPIITSSSKPTHSEKYRRGHSSEA